MASGNRFFDMYRQVMYKGQPWGTPYAGKLVSDSVNDSDDTVYSDRTLDDAFGITEYSLVFPKPKFAHAFFPDSDDDK